MVKKFRIIISPDVLKEKAVHFINEDHKL